MIEPQANQKPEVKDGPAGKPTTPDPVLERYKARTERLDKLVSFVSYYAPNTHTDCYGEIRDAISVFDDDEILDARRNAVKAALDAIERIAAEA